MKANVYSLDGKKVKSIDLPKAFSTPVRDDLIKRAVLSEESMLYQPQGSYKFAGLNTSAKYRGREGQYGSNKDQGMSRLSREILPKGRYGKAKRSPHVVRGRRAHPPKPEKNIIEEINHKEHMKALASALAACAHPDLVTKRHKHKYEVPMILEDGFEVLSKTKEVIKVFDALNLSGVVSKAKETDTKGVLVVVSNKEFKAARNLSGVDVVCPKDLGVRHLAPGTHPGRLAIFTQKALGELEARFNA